MNWYYEKNGAPCGPVTESQLETARMTGEIHARTRLCREGWPEWKEARMAWPEVLGEMSPDPAGIKYCVECGFPQSGLVEINGMQVCPTCKGRVLEKLREGVPMGLDPTAGVGPWRDGKLMVTGRSGPMPDCCLKCGAPPTKFINRKLTWHHPAYYAIIFVALLVYIIVALIIQKTAKLRVPLCAACNGKRLRNLAIGWLSFILSIGLFIAAMNNINSESDLSSILGLSGLGVLLFCIFWAVGVQLILAKKINDYHVWVAKVGKPLLEKLPPFPGRY